jgi:hypothetical protein
MVPIDWSGSGLLLLFFVFTFILTQAKVIAQHRRYNRKWNLPQFLIGFKNITIHPYNEREATGASSRATSEPTRMNA